MKNLLLVVLAGCMLIVLSACGQEEIEEKPEEVVEPPLIIHEPVEEEEPFLPFTLPLTGLGSEIEIKDRPVMVMVENSPAARPQSGLDQADIVYEILAEGDITRFIAVYQSQAPEVIGPVRSIRPYFIRIGDGLDTIIVHAGWSPDAKEMLTNQGRPNINQVSGGDHVYFWRSDERRAPHNLYTSMEKIRQGAEDKKFREDWNSLSLNFADEDELVQGEIASKVKINYINGYYVNYEYDEEAGHYKRSMAGKPHQDKETGEQLIGHNIIIAESSHKILDREGRREVNISGPGNGYLLQNGKAQQITWESNDGIIRAYKDGQELDWIAGKTWIHIVPIGSNIELE